MTPTSAQECQLDLSLSGICHSSVLTDQTRDGRTLRVKLKMNQYHIKQPLSAWHFVAGWNQVKQYQEIYLCGHIIKEWRKLFFAQCFVSLFTEVLHTNRNCFGFEICMKSQVSLIDMRFVPFATFGPSVQINVFPHVSLVTGTNTMKWYMVFLVLKCISVSATY